MADEHCARCGATDPQSGSPMVGWAQHGELRLCIPCSNMAEIGELRARRPMGAYLSGDGTRITTGTGGVLMHVVRSWQVPNPIGQHWLTHVVARDVHGAWWYGKGSGRGMCLVMRPRKPLAHFR